VRDMRTMLQQCVSASFILLSMGSIWWHYNANTDNKLNSTKLINHFTEAYENERRA
jgi:hypothetical protein